MLPYQHRVYPNTGMHPCWVGLAFLLPPVFQTLFLAHHFLKGLSKQTINQNQSPKPGHLGGSAVKLLLFANYSLCKPVESIRHLRRRYQYIPSIPWKLWVTNNHR